MSLHKKFEKVDVETLDLNSLGADEWRYLVRYHYNQMFAKCADIKELNQKFQDAVNDNATSNDRARHEVGEVLKGIKEGVEDLKRENKDISKEEIIKIQRDILGLD